MKHLKHTSETTEHLKHRLATCVKTPEILKHNVAGGHGLPCGELQWPASVDQEDIENNSPTYTSAAGLTFQLWCLRLAAGDDVKADDDLVLVASGWW